MYYAYPRLLIALLVYGFCIVGCSGSGNPTVPSDYNSQPDLTEFQSVGVSETFPDGNPAAGKGIMGLFNLRINPEIPDAELIPIRQTALTDTLEIVDITNFLKMAPCNDCAIINSISLDINNNLVLNMGIKHPFAPSDPASPISGKNRADLHVFNVEGYLISNSPGTTFGNLGETISEVFFLNPDAFSKYLDTSIDEIFLTDATLHPYILHFDDYSIGNFDPAYPTGFQSVTDPPPSGNLVMAMGSDYDYQDYILNPSAPIDLIFAVGCTYAVSSATKSDRFNPEYRVPQHNKKAASEVSLEIITNDLEALDTLSSAEIEVHVVDINHGVAVGTNLDEMFADSSVDDIFIEIPGVMTNLLVLDGNNPVSGTGHDPSDPLIYAGTIVNTAGGDQGTYSGLIKVTDNYLPGQNAAPLLNGMDGIKRVDPVVNPLDGLFPISDFASYQTFEIYVETGNEQPVAILASDPDPADITQFGTVDFDGTASYDTDGSITQYEFDFEWDQIEANFSADETNSSGLATSSSYGTTGTFAAGLRVTDDLGGQDYDSLTVNVSELSVIFVDDSNTSGTEDGSQTYPYDTIQEGLSHPGTFDEIWVDDSGNDYTGPITLAAGVALRSVNWDNGDGADQASIYSTGSTIVTGTEGAIIDGFKIYGGTRYGIYISGVSCTIQDCLVTQIIGSSTAYGIYIANSPDTVIDGGVVYDIRTTANWPATYGIYVTNASGFSIEGCEISEVVSGGSWPTTVGLYLNNAPASVIDCVISDIHTGGNWPSIHGILASGCVPQAGNHLEIRMNDVHNIYTSGSWTDATGIYVSGSNDADVVNNLVYSVTSGSYDTAMGIRFDSSENVEMVSNTVYDIEKTGYYGVAYGAYIYDCLGFDGRNNIVNRVLAPGYFQTAYCVYGTAGTVWEYCDAYQTKNSIYTGGITAGIGCISADPAYINPGTDFHLASGSPCIDTGDPTIYDPDSSRSDMGCYGGPGGDW